jgi:hypothetical protein
VLSVLLRITDSDYPSEILKLLLLFGTSDCCQYILFIFFRNFVNPHDCEDDKPSQSIKLSCARENRWDNQEWTMLGYWQGCALNAQDLDLNNNKKENKAYFRKLKR